MTPPKLRCAIYTRKSTEHNLDLAFNSLDAQREACEAYIKSQAHEGWLLVPDHFDDGAFSGASLDRPALQSLIASIKARCVDVVVVYKVDRLTRSLSDFAKLVELFDAHGVSFVSITQSFNTTSSMGRLTLNVLLSFAQFEREVISERVRDKIAASKRKGLWLGGQVPFGYRAIDKKLEIMPQEAELVTYFFETYLRLGSVKALLQELEAKNISPPNRCLQNGREITGRRWTLGHLGYVLKNRCYIGEIVHSGAIYPANHEPIVARSLFEAVQERLAAQSIERRVSARSEAYLLQGLLFDDLGHPMSPSHTNKKGIRYRYYISQALLQGRSSEAGSVARVSAPDVEALVLSALRTNSDLGQGIILQNVSKVTVSRTQIIIAMFPSDEAAHPSKLVVPFTAPSQLKKGVSREPRPQAHLMDDRAREHMLRMIARSRRWYRALIQSETTIEAIARTEEITPRYVRRLLTLAFLSPKIIQSIVQGVAPATWTPSRLTESMPMEWQEQERLIWPASQSSEPVSA